MVGQYFNFAEELLLLNIQFCCIRHAHTDMLSHTALHLAIDNVFSVRRIYYL